MIETHGLGSSEKPPGCTFGVRLQADRDRVNADSEQGRVNPLLLRAPHEPIAHDAEGMSWPGLGRNLFQKFRDVLLDLRALILREQVEPFRDA
jgi:hypothetical protein